MTNLRKRMTGRAPAPQLLREDVRAIYVREQFAKHFGKSPDKLGPDELRSTGLSALRTQAGGGKRGGRVAALRFSFTP